MLRTPLLTLIALCLFAVGVQAGHGWGGWGRPPRRDVSPPAPLTKTFTTTGEKVLDAEEVALEEAADWIAEQPQFGWRPSAQYLRDRKLLEIREVKEENLRLAGVVKVVTFELVIPPKVVEELREKGWELRDKVRQERAIDREWLLARILAGAVGLIVVVGGYLRLEEMTRGYYAYLLRAAAAVVLGVVGAAICLLG